MVNNVDSNKKRDEDINASDQGIVFGYASDETNELMPFSHVLATKISERLTEVRKNRLIPYLRPDGKALVALEYKHEDNDLIPVRVSSVVIAIQHDSDVNQETLKKAIKDNVIKQVVPRELLDSNTQVLINNGGPFVTGGPEANTGITGKKVVCDTYGGWGSNGGKSILHSL